jgi:glycosyltransferase involved in cell wall biosynthesis
MDKVLYISSMGKVHDYRFLKKLADDYELTYLHYSASEVMQEIKELNIRVIHKKPFKNNLPLLSELPHLKKVYKTIKPDIVHTGYVWQTGILASMLNLHPHLSMAWGSDILIEPEKHFMIKMMVRKVMNQCDHIQCDAEVVKSKIISLFNTPADKITVFPWGIDLALYKKQDKEESRKELGLNPDDMIFICTRPLEKLYRVTELLHVFKDFAKGKKDVKLVLATDGTLRDEVLHFIEDSNLQDKILFKGWIKYYEMPVYYNAADVNVSNSSSDGTSLSMLEAMACGCGLIVTDVPAIIEWVNKDNGFIVSREDPGEFKQAMEKYYSDRSLINTHGRKNIELAKEKADWDKNYLKLKDIYSNLRKNPSAS